MAKTQSTALTGFTHLSQYIPGADPNNVQIKKGFVFNETGNIMMATTDLENQTIEQSVRDCFAEVSVFFAAMTKALEKDAEKKGSPLWSNAEGDSFNFSLYDYSAMKKIIDNSGCFVQVNEEDMNVTTDSFGMTFSKELLEAVLGLATGTGELAFAQAMVSSMGKAGAKIAASDQSENTKVANIIFVCEYLLGMPVISAVVVTADANQKAFTTQIGPCISIRNTSTSLKIHKDSYMFVTPAFIKRYSGDIISGIDDPQFEKLTEIFDNYLDPAQFAPPTGGGSSTSTN
jgi:hypothetical protein